MPTVDNITQALSPANVGVGSKTFNPRLIKGALIVPQNTIISAANLLTLQTYLQSMANENLPDKRLYPIANFVDFKDGSEKPITQTFGYGGEVTVRDGIYKWSFQYIKGGKTLNDALRTFNGSEWDFFLVDQKNVLMGALYTDPATGALGIQSIPSIEIYTSPFVASDGKKVSEYVIEFKFDPKYLNELGGFIADADFDILDTIYGLQDLDLIATANVTAKTFNIAVKTHLGQDVGALYSSASGLGNVALWKAKVTADNTSLTISTVVWDTLTSSFILTIGATGYPVSGTITFDLVGPTELAAGGVSGFESSAPVTATAH